MEKSVILLSVKQIAVTILECNTSNYTNSLKIFSYILEHHTTWAEKSLGSLIVTRVTRKCADFTPENDLLEKAWKM